MKGIVNGRSEVYRRISRLLIEPPTSTKGSALRYVPVLARRLTLCSEMLEPDCMTSVAQPLRDGPIFRPNESTKAFTLRISRSICALASPGAKYVACLIRSH